MCELEQPRFLTWSHTIILGDPEVIPLDEWLCQTIPPEYRVCGVTMQQIIDHYDASIRHCFIIVGELRHG